MGKIIAVSNNKGGCLKTSVVVNLSGLLAKQGKRVLIIDADNQGNVALSFGLSPDDYQDTIYDVLIDGMKPENAIFNAYENIDVLIANDDLDYLEFDVLTNMNKYDEPFMLLKDRLDGIETDYDYVLIDTPPSLSLMNGNVFTFSDKVIIPYAPELYSMRSLIEVVKTVQDFKDVYNPNLEILGVLRTLVNMQTNLHTDIIQETHKYAYENGIHIFETIIPRTIQFANAVSYNKKPATLLKKKDKALLYYDLWEEIETLLEGNVVKWV